ncbi:MAG: DUF817 family protein [Acinetobacter sp.]|nr:DUF817 family protein [Acinetobacter sp.]
MFKSILFAVYDFTFKAVSAALFGILLLLAFAITAPMGHESYFGLYRYDYLLLFSISIQALLIYFKLETWHEAKVIALFHFLGFVMELYLTHPAIGSWQYPQPATLKLWTVPLFAGFMYSAVGSFFARALRLYQVSFEQLPSFRNMLALSVLSYLNFMTKFFVPDIRYGLFVWSVLIFYKTKVSVQVGVYHLKFPMLLILMLLALIIWIAENISTFYQIWLYPTQVEQWHRVGYAKMGSWYLLLMLSLVLVMKVLRTFEKRK